MRRTEGQAVQSLEEEGRREVRLHRQADQTDNCRSGTCQEQPQPGRAAPDGLAPKNENDDLGEDTDRPQRTDRRIREADGAPVDAAEGIDGAVARLNEGGAGHDQPQETRYGRRLRARLAPSRTTPLTYGNRDPGDRDGKQSRRGNRKGNDPGAKGVDEIAAADRGAKEGQRAPDADSTVMEVRMPPDRLCRDEVVARQDRRLRDGQKAAQRANRPHTVGHEENREAAGLPEMAEDENPSRSRVPVRQGEERRRGEDASDNRNRHHEPDLRRGQRLAIEPDGKEGGVDAEPDEARGIHRRKPKTGAGPGEHVTVSAVRGIRRKPVKPR
jgi:hypothetical protein